MTRRAVRAAIVAAVILAALATIACHRSDPAEPRPAAAPSVILITVDTLRADHVGAYGHAEARTPVLDRLAHRGVLFAAATTPFPRTTPALASMMTGLLPWRHGSREVGEPMAAGLSTLAGILAGRGYATLGVCVNGAASPAQHLDTGFERFLDYTSFADHTAAGVTDATIGLVDEVLGGGAPGSGAAEGRALSPRPFFLWVHYIDPHFPYSPPDSWRDQPVAPACRDMVARSGSDLVATAHLRIDLRGEASAALADCSALYDAEIAFTDSQIGRLLDALEARGLGAGSYVVFTSDHGENLGEDGLYYEHGPSVNDASLRVPLLIAGPGIEPGADAGIARLEDLAPTLLAMVGVPVEVWPAFDGVDLSPRLLGPARWLGQGGAAGAINGGRRGRRARDRASAAAPAVAAYPRVAVAESGGALLPETFTYLFSGHPGDRQCVNGSRFSLCVDPGGEPRLYDHVADPFLTRDRSAEFPDVRQALDAVRYRWPPGAARERTLRGTRYKLVERPLPEGGWSSSLYDLETDPGETRDVAGEKAKLVAKMRRRLDAAFDGASPPAAPELEPRELEALRALGYVR